MSIRQVADVACPPRSCLQRLQRRQVSLLYIGVARGCSGCTCTPRAVKKNFFRPNLQEKCVSAPQDIRTWSAPPSQSKSQCLGQFLRGGLDLEVYLNGLWGRRVKKVVKKVVNFFGKKVHPKQNPGYAYASLDDDDGDDINDDDNNNNHTLLKLQT